MQKTLNRLCQAPGVTGSFIVGGDGMIVATNVSSQIDEEEVGALASSIVNTVVKASAHLNQGALRSVVLETETGRLFFSPSKVGYLVTVASNDANLGMLRLEMNSAVRDLNEFGA